MELLAYADWVEIPNPNNARTWLDYDLNDAGCPADTIGVLVCFIRSDATAPNEANEFGVRPNGSTDTHDSLYRHHESKTSGYFRRDTMFCGCDANKIIEIWTRAPADMTTSKMMIMGWFTGTEAHFLTNIVAATYSSGPTAGQWNECHFDSAIQGGDTPQAWLTHIGNSHWNRDRYDVRPAGNSLDLRMGFQYDSCGGQITTPGTNNRLDAYIDDLTDPHIGVRGYIKSGYVDLWASPVAVDANTEQVWETKTVGSIPADSVAVVRADPSASGAQLGVRDIGSSDTDTPCTNGGPAHPLIKIDSNNQFQIYDKWHEFIYITGYFEGGPTQHDLVARDMTCAGNVEGKGITQPAAVPPTYGDYTFYYDVPIDPPVDLSVGWVNANPDGFSAANLPDGVVVSPQGMMSGTPVCPTTTLTARDMTNDGQVDGASMDTTHHLGGGVIDAAGAVQKAAVDHEIPVEGNYELEFGGDTEIVISDIILQQSQTYTFEVDVYADAAASGRGVLGCVEFAILARNNNQIGVYNWDKMTSGASYNYLTWETVTVVVPGGSGDATSSVNGGATSNHSRGSVSSTSNALAIGARGPGGGGINWMLGRLKNVKMWTGNKGTLVHEWPVNDNSTTIKDIVGSSDGTLTIGSGTWHDVGGGSPPTGPVLNTPTNFRVTGQTTTSIDLAWDLSDNGDADGFQIEASEDGDNWVNPQVSTYPITDRSCTQSGGNPGTTYNFRIRTYQN